MASKVMMKIPVAPFAQVNKGNVNNSGTDLVNNGSVAGGRKPEPNNQNNSNSINNNSNSTGDMQRTTAADSRVAQLEQNIKFLQEQHQMMLAGLHNEIDSLRHRNRELQFQLVFAKGSLPSSPSSPEDDTKPKVYASSPKNMTPLQVELLERELGELKIQMQEIESRNVYLSAIVDEQKKKLERYERDRERERERGIQPDPELLRKLDDAESLIRRLRRENSDLRREHSLAAAAVAAVPSPTASSSASNGTGPAYHNQTYQQNHQRGGGGGGQSNRNNQRHRGGNNGGNGHYNNRGNNWFPPLNAAAATQFWQGGRNNGIERGGGSNVASSTSDNALPTLQNGHNTTSSATSGGGGHQYHHHNNHHGRRGGNNNNHYSHNNGEARKYRGGQNRSSKPS